MWFWSLCNICSSTVLLLADIWEAMRSLNEIHQWIERMNIVKKYVMCFLIEWISLGYLYVRLFLTFKYNTIMCRVITRTQVTWYMIIILWYYYDMVISKVSWYVGVYNNWLMFANLIITFQYEYADRMWRSSIKSRTCNFN